MMALQHGILATYTLSPHLSALPLFRADINFQLAEEEQGEILPRSPIRSEYTAAFST